MNWGASEIDLQIRDVWLCHFKSVQTQGKSVKCLYSGKGEIDKHSLYMCRHTYITSNKMKTSFYTRFLSTDDFRGD